MVFLALSISGFFTMLKTENSMFYNMVYLKDPYKDLYYFSFM
jgi:hypothetical protein